MPTGGTWNPASLPTRPGLYINFKDAALAQIAGGTLGIVAIPLKTYGAGATAKNVYTVTNETEATALFGATNIQSILFALQGGAKEVLVYAMPATPTTIDYDDMRAELDARKFDVFVFDDEADATQRDATKTWCATNRTEGKHFACVFGGTSVEDADPTTGDLRSTTLNDDYVINLINGVVINEVSYDSSAYAPYIAGLIAGTSVNKSITYTVLPVDDVTKRMTNAQIKTSLTNGSLVLVHDGEKVRIEQGLTTAVGKIRKMRAEQAIATDVPRLAADNYIGKVDNNSDGQAALISAVKLYLETLRTNNVLTGEINVGLDTQYQSVGDSVYLAIEVTEQDSMERIFLTITTN